MRDASCIHYTYLFMSLDVLVETPFERRLIAIKEKFGESLVRTPTYTFCETIEATDEVMATR